MQWQVSVHNRKKAEKKAKYNEKAKIDFSEIAANGPRECFKT
jgi:hypothetical protein